MENSEHPLQKLVSIERSPSEVTTSSPQQSSALLPSGVTRDSGTINLQLFYAASLLKINPGLGAKTDILAKDLMNSGLKPSEAIALLQAVYSPTYESGRGQATRAKYFSEAFQERYGGELEKISRNITMFRRVLMEVSEASESRDILKGEGYSITFHEAFLYSEVGLDAENYLRMAQELRQENMSSLAIQRMIRKAALTVKRDPSLSLESLVLKRDKFGWSWEDVNAEDVEYVRKAEEDLDGKRTK